MKIIDPTYTFKDDLDAHLLVEHKQEITDDFLSGLKTARNESSNRRMGEMERVASIPTVVVEKWLREGFDIFAPGVSAREIVARLRNEDLDAFITTSKRV